jgi:hypothetical protein
MYLDLLHAHQKPCTATLVYLTKLVPASLTAAGSQTGKNTRYPDPEYSGQDEGGGEG